MANITAQMVKELRESTGAGMMDCKAALTETGGEMQAAQDWLRKKGLSKAAKKAGRVAAEGLIGVRVQGTKGVVVEVNSETDFVARNDLFQGLVKMIADVALGVGTDVEKIKKAQPGMPIFVYKAGHGFHCDERGSYNKASADLAWGRTKDFLAKNIIKDRFVDAVREEMQRNAGRLRADARSPGPPRRRAWCAAARDLLHRRGPGRGAVLDRLARTRRHLQARPRSAVRQPVPRYPPDDGDDRTGAGAGA